MESIIEFTVKELEELAKSAPGPCEVLGEKLIAFFPGETEERLEIVLPNVLQYVDTEGRVDKLTHPRFVLDRYNDAWRREEAINRMIALGEDDGLRMFLKGRWTEGREERELSSDERTPEFIRQNFTELLVRWPVVEEANPGFDMHRQWCMDMYSENEVVLFARREYPTEQEALREFATTFDHLRAMGHGDPSRVPQFSSIEEFVEYAERRMDEESSDSYPSSTSFSRIETGGVVYETSSGRIFRLDGNVIEFEAEDGSSSCFAQFFPYPK